MRRKWTVLTLSLILLMLCISAAYSTKVESNVLKFFPDDSTIAKDYGFIAERLTGLYTVELDIESDLSDESEVIAAISSLSAKIATREEVARVDSLPVFQDLWQPAQRSLTLIEGMPEPPPELVELREYLEGKFRRVENGRVNLRVSILVTAMESSAFSSLLRSIDQQVQQLLPPNSRYNTTGVVSLLNGAQADLVSTQIRSFSAALLVVLLLMGMFTLSLRAAFAALLPNLLPIACVFGLMTLAGIALDAATVMIASVAIGIAADDTIHFLLGYRRQVRTTQDSDAAIMLTLCEVGRPVICTSVVAALGFGILLWADFRPLIYFGLLTGITMLTALAADLFILPACIRLVRLWEKA